MAWNARGDRLLSASVDGRIQVSDAHSGICLHAFEAGFAWHAAWFGDQLALAMPEGRVALWNLDDQKPQPVADLWGTPHGGLVVTADGYVAGPTEALDWIRFVDAGWAVYEHGELGDRHDPERVQRLLASSIRGVD